MPTNGFTFEDVCFLNSLIEDKFGFLLQVTKQKNNYVLNSFDTKKSKIILRYIDPVFPLGMERKSDIWRRVEAELYIDEARPLCPYCNDTKIMKQGWYANGDVTWVCKPLNKLFRAAGFVEKIQLPKPIYLRQKIVL